MLRNIFTNGFGMRCVDAMTSLDQNSIESNSVALSNIENGLEIMYAEIDDTELEGIYQLKQQLVKHLNSSPIFMPTKPYELQSFIDLCKKRKSRFFVARNNIENFAFIEVKAGGESSPSFDESVSNISGAFMLPEYRGNGIFTKLLGFTFDKLRKSGYKRCGVDFESINPEAF
jgi:GNAT superfamily N-acetyltransferase